GYVRRAECVLDFALLVHASGLNQVEQDCLRVVNPGEVLVARQLLGGPTRSGPERGQRVRRAALEGCCAQEVQPAPTGRRGDNIVELAFSQPIQDMAGSGMRDKRLVEQRLDEVVSARIVPALLVQRARKAGHGGT